MVIDVILTIAGVGVLLLLTFGALIAAQGRRSDQLLVAPRGARFGDASRLTRKAARLRLNTVVNPNPESTVISRTTFVQSDRHAA
jgi:hypothetical protein